MSSRSLRVLEVACGVTGVLLLAAWSVALIGGEAAKNRAIADFAEARAAFVVPDSGDAPPPHATPVANASVDPKTEPIALLAIPRIAFEVPVFADTSERNLNRGAGWIEGTAAPGEYGNTGIAGHRDRYFRILKDVVVGDVVELDTVSQRRTYRVTRISIVKPADNSSLRPTETDAVTLVTCYPFYYVGHAPKRYVVRAVEVSETAQAGNWPESTAR